MPVASPAQQPGQMKQQMHREVTHDNTGSGTERALQDIGGEYCDGLPCRLLIKKAQYILNITLNNYHIVYGILGAVRPFRALQMMQLRYRKYIRHIQDFCCTSDFIAAKIRLIRVYYLSKSNLLPNKQAYKKYICRYKNKEQLCHERLITFREKYYILF